MKSISTVLVVGCLLGGLVHSSSLDVAAQTIDRNAKDISLQLEIQHAYDRGAKALVERQEPEGYWSTADHPALTAIVLAALGRDPSGRASERYADAIEKGYEFLEASVQPDGGVYREDALLNYNTALSIMAFVIADDPKYHPIIKKARRFIVGWQSDFDTEGELDSPLDGGVGYGGSYPHSDLSNTLLALEAMYTSRFVEGEEPLIPGENDLDWKAAIHFVQNCQNLPSVNGQGWASGDPDNRGGFVYFPGNTKSDEVELENGRIALRSYGSMSYAGLLSLIYADLDRDDPRIVAVMDWLGSHFSLEENPGMGAQGLYYYFHTMAKAMAVTGENQLKSDEGAIDWRKDLALKLMNLQREDGTWINDSARWWENDRDMVTAYTLSALAFVSASLEN